MKISKIVIEDKIKEKILYKHGIMASEVKEIMLSDPYVLKARENRYMAIGYSPRFITTIFELTGDIAFIVTAYPSSDAQRKLYKRKKG